jgi:hypothetical protein
MTFIWAQFLLWLPPPDPMPMLGYQACAGNSRKVFQHMEVVGSHQMITCLPSFKNTMLSSPWETRGRTLQERVLSRRLLVFSEAQVHFFCAEMQFWEETILEVSQGQVQMYGPWYQLYQPYLKKYTSESGVGLNSGRIAEDLELYCTAVAEYTKRHLSKSEDALNAFQGLLTSFGDQLIGRPNKFLWGIPAAAFSYGLCWHTTNHCPQARRNLFPSWTWAGWATPIHMAGMKPNGNGGRIRYQQAIQQVSVNDELSANWNFRIGPEPFKDLPIFPDLQLRFWTSSVLLFVGRTANNYIRSFPCYDVCSPLDDMPLLGWIQLDKLWRAEQPDLLEFIVIKVESVFNVSIRLHVLCIERDEDIAYRVQQPIDQDGFCTDEQWMATKPVEKFIVLG